jgi:LysR family transcriptional regulator, benzoate and cis,cis-muconate-responsive activator of ben and cat genes
VGLAHKKERSFPAHLINTILTAKQQLLVNKNPPEMRLA